MDKSRQQREIDKFVALGDETGVIVNITNPDGTPVDSSNPFPIIISDGVETVDVIPTNGLYGLVSIAPGHVSTDNSTEDPNLLLADESFTGEWEEIVNFGVIVISVTSDVTSATDGLMVQFSTQGSENSIVTDDVFTIGANAKKTFSFQAATKFFRIIYTNGGSDQGHFHLQTILKPYYVKPSSHRINDNISPEDDAELVKAILTGQKPNGDFTNFQGTAAGNFKVSLEEYDSTFLDNPLPIINGFNIPVYDDIDITYVAAGNGAGEIETVIYKASAATVATLTLSYNSDDKLTDVVQT